MVPLQDHLILCLLAPFKPMRLADSMSGQLKFDHLHLRLPTYQDFQSSEFPCGMELFEEACALNRRKVPLIRTVLFSLLGE